nr:hypothetical protein [Tanacetum cinerariifolium]
MKCIYTRSRNSVGTLFLHCARTIEHRVLSYTYYSCQVSDEILGTQSREFRRTSSLCVVLILLPEVSPEHLSEMSSGDLSAELVACMLFRYDFRKYHRNTFRRCLPVAFWVPSSSWPPVSCDQLLEYAIPLDLHPCVPLSVLTMSRLSADKIGLNGLAMFEIYYFSLEINPSINLFCAFYKINKQDSSVVDPPPTGIQTEDIH